MVQDFDRLSNPNCPFNRAQANLTKHEQCHRLHEKFFAPGVNNRRFPSPKTKPCENLKKSFHFAFGHSLSSPSFFLFFHVSPSHCQTQNRFGYAPKKFNLPDVLKLALVPPLAHVGFTDLFVFITLPFFYLERSFLHQNQA